MGEEKMIREETMRYLIEGERLSYEKTLKRVVIAFSLIILVLLGIIFYIVYNFDVEMVDVEQDGEGVKYTVATEACADRAAISDGIRDVIANNTAQTQAILDKLCALELDGYKRENDNLRQQLNMSQLNASQTAQTAQILAGQAAEIDGVYNRLKNCPVGTYNVCNPLTPANCGCGCNGGF